MNSSQDLDRQRTCDRRIFAGVLLTKFAGRISALLFLLIPVVAIVRSILTWSPFPWRSVTISMFCCFWVFIITWVMVGAIVDWLIGRMLERQKDCPDEFDQIPELTHAWKMRQAGSEPDFPITETDAKRASFREKGVASPDTYTTMQLGEEDIRMFQEPYNQIIRVLAILMNGRLSRLRRWYYIRTLHRHFNKASYRRRQLGEKIDSFLRRTISFADEPVFTDHHGITGLTKKAVLRAFLSEIPEAMLPNSTFFNMTQNARHRRAWEELQDQISAIDLQSPR